MNEDAILACGVKELRDLVATGKVSADEVLRTYRAQIEVQDEEVHAYLRVDDRAASVAAAVDSAVARGDDVGPLAGVPIAVKDNIATKGCETTAGSRILEGWVPPYDATVVSRLKDAGALLVGKTNLDEFAMGSSTENSAYGPTRNPFDLSRVPGGSSGGSAAAVAGRMALGALGSDTGGSVRQPAAFTGTVGFKPTYGRVSRYGLLAFSSSLDQIGPLTLTVDDCAQIMAVISGHDPMDATSLRSAIPDYVGACDRGVKGFRVGVIKELMEVCAHEMAEATTRAGELLAQSGAQLGEVSIPEVVFGLSAYYVVAPAEASSNLARYDGVRYGRRVDAETTEQMMVATRSEGFGPEVKRRIMLGTYVLSAGYFDAFYVTAQRVRTLVRAAFVRAYEDFDLLLCPTTPTTAFALGSKSADPVEMYRSDVCTVPSSLAGHPAISVPFGFDGQGLPIGVQLLAGDDGEERLFAAASVLEREG